MIEPFRTPVDADALEDLHRRLSTVRWPGAGTVDDWSQGTPLHEAQSLWRYWCNSYDWPARAALLDRYPQFRTTIEGVGIHFVHARSSEPNALPLLLTHGWPGSIVEFQEVIGPLTDPVGYGGHPEDAFDVICPSLPGYGWSDAPTEPGWGSARIASAWAMLMERLGYARYGAQGGDWGAMVTTALGGLDPDHLVGIHLNMPLAFGDGESVDETERKITKDFQHFMTDGSAYQQLQSTRPQSLGYGLVDSPVALASWILEKLWAWSDHGGDVTECFSFDQILDNVMLYWLSATGTSSARLYWEDSRGRIGQAPVPPVSVPVGCSIFPKELVRTSRRWAEMQFGDLRYFNEPDRGGHFAAFEQPALFVDEVRACFRTMR
jgi:epoxide hydrolase